MLSAIDNDKIMEFNGFTKLELVHQVDLFPSNRSVLILLIKMPRFHRIFTEYLTDS